MYEEDDDGPDDRESDLAKEFETHCKTVQQEIKTKVDEARAALRAAEEIAEKHGVPFRSSISFLSNSFVPASFNDSKFKDLSHDTVEDISGVWGEYIDDLFYSGGWLHSAVC